MQGKIVSELEYIKRISNNLYTLINNIIDLNINIDENAINQHIINNIFLSDTEVFNNYNEYIFDYLVKKLGTEKIPRLINNFLAINIRIVDNEESLANANIRINNLTKFKNILEKPTIKINRDSEIGQYYQGLLKYVTDEITSINSKLLEIDKKKLQQIKLKEKVKEEEIIRAQKQKEDEERAIRLEIADREYDENLVLEFRERDQKNIYNIYIKNYMN